MGNSISRAVALPWRRPSLPRTDRNRSPQMANGVPSAEHRVSTSTGRGRESDQRARYGGPQFRAAASLQLSGGLGRPDRLVKLLVAAALRPRRFVALMDLLLRTPSETVFLSQSEAGHALRRYFDERFLGVLPRNRLCRGVLVLPKDHVDYFRGHRRQALRTNLRRATGVGIWCEAIADPFDAMAALELVLAGRRNNPEDLVKLTDSWRPLIASPETTLLVARDRDGHPLGLCAAVIDPDVCLIRFAVASDHNARWALHDYLVRTVIKRGATYLFAEGDGPLGALGFPPELHHYQHLLGYELRHLIPHTEGGSSRPAFRPHRQTDR